MSDLDLMDAAPELPRFAREQADEVLADRRPSMGEFLGASVREGWWNTTIGANRAMVDAERARQANPEPLPRHEWEASQYWRPGVSWDERMTVGRAQAIAAQHDENRYRRQVMAARDPGFLEATLGFGGQIVGTVPDPVNFLPIAGPLARGARVAGAGRVAAALEAPTMAGAVTRGVTEGVGGNLAAMPFLYGVQAEFGDDVTWSRALVDLAAGAVIGAGFGALGGALSRLGTAPDPVAATRTLDLAARDVAAGRQVEIPRGLVVREIEDTLFRAAPDEARLLIRETMSPDGTVSRSLDLPSRPDGTALSREELDAWVMQRQQAATPGEIQALAEVVQTIERRVADGSMTREQARAVLSEIASIRPPERAPEPATPPGVSREARRELAGIVQTIERRLAEGTLSKDQARAILTEISNISAPMKERGAVLYEWYQAAHHAQQQMARLSEAPVIRPPEAPTPRAAAPAQPAAQGEARPGSAPAPQGTARAAADADPDLAAASAQLDTLRAEGRLIDADDALIRAAAEQADEMDAIANGIEQAGACLLRNLA